jgi:MIP family channel proteins
MADVLTDSERQHADALRYRYLIRFEEDTLKQRPMWIRVIVEFLGTFVLVTVAAGSGVVNHYAGGGPISRTAAVIAPGAAVMAMIYAWGPLSGLHINPAVTVAFAGRGVFPAAWVVPYWAAQLGGSIAAALFLQAMFGDVSAGGNYPIAKPGGDWRSLVMEIVLTAILVSIILHTATGHRSIGHNAAIAVGSTVALLGLFASPISGASMNPARTLGPDIVGADYAGWWVYVAGPLIGAAIAVMVIALMRGLPDRQEQEAAEGGALPLWNGPARRERPRARGDETVPSDSAAAAQQHCHGRRSGPDEAPA